MTDQNQEMNQIEAGEYVLGVMTDGERRDFERRVMQSPDLQREVKVWQEHFSSMSRKLPTTKVSPGVWSGIDQRIQAGKGGHGASADSQVSQNAGSASSAGWLNRLWKGWAVAATAALVVLSVNVSQQSALDAAPRYMAVMKSPDQQSEWLIEAIADGQVRLYQIGALPVQPETQEISAKSLQLWTKAPGAASPTSLGLVKLGEPWIIPAEALPDLMQEQIFEVTLEPEKGSPYADRPTGPVMFIGRTVAIPSL